MKSRGSQASVTDETVQFLADHRFGQLGDDLPEGIVKCPETDEEPDAGVPDAGAPDEMIAELEGRGIEVVQQG